MVGNWNAEFTSDPQNVSGLYIEILENDEYRGRIYFDAEGKLLLQFYETSVPFTMPADWLLLLLEDAKSELAYSQKSTDVGPTDEL